MRLYYFLLAGLIFFLASCELIEDPGKIKAPEWNPSFSVAILNTEISFEDGLNQLGENEYVEVDSAGNISLVYQGNLLEGQQFELLDIPDFVVPMFLPSLDFPFPVSQMDRLDLKEGDLSFSFETDEPEPFTLVVIVDALLQAGEDYRGTFDFGRSGSHEANIDLEGMSILPRQGNIHFGYEARRISDNQLISLDNFVFQARNLQYSYAEGYLGQQNLELALDSIQLSFGEAVKEVEFNIAEPEIDISIHNSFGIPLEIQIPKLQVYQDGNIPIDVQSEELREGLVLNHPNTQELGLAKTTEIHLDKDNSNLPQAISMIPDGVIWSVGAVVYPDGDSTQTGFITDSSSLSVDLSAKIPLKGSLNNLSFTQDISVSLAEVDMLEAAGVKMIVENEIPLGISLQIYLLDDDEQVVDSIFSGLIPLLNAADVDVNGRVAGPSASEIDVDLDEEKLQRLFETTNFRLKAELSTSQSGSIPVQFTSHNKVGIQLGVRAKADISE